MSDKIARELEVAQLTNLHEQHRMALDLSLPVTSTSTTCTALAPYPSPNRSRLFCPYTCWALVIIATAGFLSFLIVLAVKPEAIGRHG